MQLLNLKLGYRRVHTFPKGISLKVHLIERLGFELVLYSHVHHHSASQRHNIKDRRMNKRRSDKDAGRKTQEGRTHEGWKTQEDFLNNIFTSLFIARFEKGCSRFACERVLGTEHKLHILTPLL